MLLRNPFYIDNMHADQPYSSMYIIAPYCYRKCRGCQNKHLQDAELVDFTPEQLASQFLSNPFWDGVTLAGLEPFYCDNEWWIEFEEFLALAGVDKLTIYTSEPKPFREFNVKEVWWKTGEFIEGFEHKVIKTINWSIDLASNNQNFVKQG